MHQRNNRQGRASAGEQEWFTRAISQAAYLYLNGAALIRIDGSPGSARFWFGDKDGIARRLGDEYDAGGRVEARAFTQSWQQLRRQVTEVLGRGDGHQGDTTPAGQKSFGDTIMKTIFALSFIFLLRGLAAAQATPPCFFQTAHSAVGALYVDNSATALNTTSGSSYPTQLLAQYQVFGNNGVLADGPNFFVTTPCVADRIAYQTANGHLDTYNKHYKCGPGPNVGQGDTVAGSPSIAGGQCGGSYDIAYVNTYDIGIYCEGGGCTYGQLYASTGPLPYSQWYSVGNLGIGMQFFKQGPVVLPSGLYGVLMGGNCDAGSVPGSAIGTGDTLCGELAGEAGTDTSSPSGGWNGTGSEWYPHKIFSMPSAGGTSGDFHCMLYDPNHDNSIGLPSSYTVYDNGGCTRVNTGSFHPNTTGTSAVVTLAAPHASHIAIMGTPQSIVTASSKINLNTKLATGTSIH